MMIAEAKIAAGAVVAGTTGIIATGRADLPEWSRLFVEFGSFGLLAFAFVYVLLRVAPNFIMHLDKARDAFLVELREERLMREKHFAALESGLRQIDTSIRDLQRSVDNQG
jgi:hypothetical protein